MNPDILSALFIQSYLKGRVTRMLQYEIAKAVYAEMKAKLAQSDDEDLDYLFKKFLENAVDYAKIRTSWAFMDRAARTENDKSRSILHDSFISILGAICRNLGIEGINDIMPDRKTKGDFACYIAMFLALEQR